MKLLNRLDVRGKIIFAIAFLIIALFVIEVAILNGVFLRSFEAVEQENTIEGVQRVEGLIKNEINNYSIKLVDWTNWDDTYGFIDDGNKEYITSNLGDSSLINLRLNFMFFIASNGAMMYEKRVSFETGREAPVPKDLHDLLLKKTPITTHKSNDSKFQGVIRIKDGILLIVARPILTSSGEGPIRGTMVFGRFLDEGFSKKIATLEGSNVKIHNYYSDLPEDVEEAKKLMSKEGIKRFEKNGDLDTYFINRKSTNKISGFTVVSDDLSKEPAFIIKNELSRPFYVIAQNLVTFIGLFLAGASLISVILAIVLLNKLVVSKITKLKKDVSSVSNPSTLNTRLEILGNDEFSDLAKNINLMLDEITRSNEQLMVSGNALKQEKDKLDAKIFELNNAQKAMLSLLEDEKNSEEQLKTKSQDLLNFKLAIESTSDHIIMTDPQGITIYANKGAEKLTGYSFKEMSGKTPSLWGRQMSKEFYEKLWDTIKNKKQTFSGEITNKRKNGELYPVEARITPILDEKGNIKFFIGVERDISSEKKLAERLIKENEIVEKQVQEQIELINTEKVRFSASINSLKIGFIMFDKNGKVLFSNRSFERILSMTNKPENLQDIDSLLGQRLSLNEKFTECMDQGQPLEVKELEFEDKFLHLYFAPIFSNDNSFEIIGEAVLVEDITERKIIDRSKDEFFSIASHELRTPLTAIKGNTSLIKQYYMDKLPDEDIKGMIEDISKSSERLIHIVNDFLNMSRLEMGRMVFKIDKLDINGLTKEVIDEYLKTGIDKNLYIKFDEPSEPVPDVFADKDRLREVLVNLIGNSIKYTEQGGITVSIVINENAVKVLISDTGRGISIENQKLLFRKFQQAASSIYTRDALVGTGLGLYISRLMMEGMGGKISLDTSEVGKGSTFSLSLPMEPKR